MKLKVIGISLLALFVLANCKPNAKNEAQYWANHKKELAEATAKWPNFRAVLDNKMKEASAIWAESEKITNEEEKAAKMKEANEKIDELLNQFTQIKYKSEGILKAIDKIDDKKLTSSKDKIRDDAIADARKALNEVNSKMASAQVSNEEEAKAITKEVISTLISAQGDIDRATKSINKK